MGLVEGAACTVLPVQGYEPVTCAVWLTLPRRAWISEVGLEIEKSVEELLNIFWSIDTDQHRSVWLSRMNRNPEVPEALKKALAIGLDKGYWKASVKPFGDGPKAGWAPIVKRYSRLIFMQYDPVLHAHVPAQELTHEDGEQFWFWSPKDLNQCKPEDFPGEEGVFRLACELKARLKSRDRYKVKEGTMGKPWFKVENVPVFGETSAQLTCITDGDYLFSDDAEFTQRAQPGQWVRIFREEGYEDREILSVESDTCLGIEAGSEILEPTGFQIMSDRDVSYDPEWIEYNDIRDKDALDEQIEELGGVVPRCALEAGHEELFCDFEWLARYRDAVVSVTDPDAVAPRFCLHSEDFPAELRQGDRDFFDEPF